MNFRHPGRNEGVQHQMFPKHAAILRPQMIPSPRMAHQSCVEPKDLWLRHDLAPPTRGKRSHQVGDVGDLIDLQPVHDRGAADLAFRGELRDVEQPTALAQQQFQHAQKTGPLLQPEQFLHVTGKIGIQPFAIEFRIAFGRQQRGRQPSAQQAFPHIGDAERRNSSCSTGTSSTTRLRPVRLSRNFCVAARVDEPVARIFSLGNPSAPIFSKRLGSGSWWTSSNTTNRFFTDRKKLSGSRKRSATLGKSQLRNSVSGRLCASTVLPTRRGPVSQTMDACFHAAASRSFQRGRSIIQNTLLLDVYL